MYETLLTNEECAKAIDLGGFYRVPADNRGLNYDKSLETATQIEILSLSSIVIIQKLLNKEEIKEKMLKLAYIQERLAED